MSEFFLDIVAEFRRQKAAAERALAQVDQQQFFHRPGELVNPIALIVKHMAGNMASRWTDFLTTDGEKPWRDRDGEFELRDGDTREKLMADWERGWSILLSSIAALTESDLDKSITIRGEAMPARVAVIRALTHVSYHVGQIAYIMRLLHPQAAWLTISPGQSQQFNAAKLSQR